MRRRSTCFGFAALLAASVSLVQPARAQNDDARAGARAAATAGATAMEQAQWTEALDLFTRAESLMHAPPHLLYIARANVKLGKLVRARETYLKIIRETISPTAPKAFLDAQVKATAEEAELGARIPTIKVVVEGEGAQDAVVSMDGAAGSSALVGVPRPVDPGEHKFQAASKTMESEVTPITLSEGAKGNLTLKLTRPVAVQPVAPEPVAASTDNPKAEDMQQPKAEGSSTLRTGGFVALGVGVVGVALGTVFLAQNRGKRSDADALCPNGSCPRSAQSQVESLDQSASSAATISLVGYGVGVVGIGAGVTLLVMSLGHSAKTTEPTAAAIQPWFGPGSAGVSGRF